jgi:23S rRNA (adenine-N6)-dimethyltransferase
MRYKLRRKLHSQNFLHDPKLVSKLIRKTSIGKSDTVLEIGPGKGLIISELVKVAGKVIAVELDHNLYLHLIAKFTGVSNLEIFHADFLKFELPNYTYKIFANIPFIITADIVRKITTDRHMTEAYLIVQKEAAQKFIGKPYDSRNQMMAVLLKPWFEISVFHKFSRWDFIPRPNVDVVMIKIIRRKMPTVLWSSLRDYRDFIICSYNRKKGFSKLDYKEILKRYEYYIKNASSYEKKRISLLAKSVLEKQKNIQKIHRTRKDKYWVKFYKG